MRVMLVDDHAVVRMGFKLLLQAEPDIEVVAEADSGEAACQGVAAAAPDVVVMDRDLKPQSVYIEGHPIEGVSAN